MQIAMMQHRTAQHLLQPELDAAGPRRGFELPARCKRLHAWYALVTQRPSVQSTLKGPDKQDFESALVEHYSK